MIKESAKKQIAKMTNKANILRKDMHDIKQRDDLDTNYELHTHLAFLRQEHQHLDHKVNQTECAKAQAH